MLPQLFRDGRCALVHGLRRAGGCDAARRERLLRPAGNARCAVVDAQGEIHGQNGGAPFHIHLEAGDDAPDAHGDISLAPDLIAQKTLQHELRIEKPAAEFVRDHPVVGLAQQKTAVGTGQIPERQEMDVIGKGRLPLRF